MLAAEMDMTPEDKFLLAGARNFMDEEGRRKFASFLSGPLDWPEVERKAIHHGIAPLLYFNLRDNNIRHPLPDGALNRLQTAFYRTGLDNIARYEELVRILERLEQSGVEVAAVKGAALAWTVYPDAALRQMEDTDFIGPASGSATFKRVLESCGYSLTSRYSEFIILRVEDYQNRENGLRLEVSYFPEKLIKRVWSERTYLETPEARVPTLGCEDHLIFLCGHTITHLIAEKFNYLLWLCDINELIRWAGDRLDWELLLNRAKRFRMRHMVYLALSLSHRLLDTPVPRDVMNKLRLRSSVLREKVLYATLMNPERFLSTREKSRYLQTIINIPLLLDTW